MRVVADTSVWVAYLRRRDDRRVDYLDDLLAAGDVLLCGPILAELLASDRQARHLEWVLVRLPWIDLGRTAWEDVGAARLQLRRTGATTPVVDVAIAVAAVLADAPLWTLDSDFARIQAVLPALRLYDPLSATHASG